MSTPSLPCYTKLIFDECPITDEAVQTITNKFQKLGIEYREIRRTEDTIMWLTSRTAWARIWKALMDKEIIDGYTMGQM